MAGPDRARRSGHGIHLDWNGGGQPGQPLCDRDPTEGQSIWFEAREETLPAPSPKCPTAQPGAL